MAKYISDLKGDSAVRDIQNLADDGHLYAAHVINDLWRITEGNAVVVTDVGQHQMWEAQYYHHEKPRSLITSGGLGTMGFALPAAIGAKVGRPDAEVWVVVGDGGFQMTMPELATMVQEELDVKIAVINNGYLGMVRQWQEFFYQRRYAATPISGPDFAKLAEAFGVRGMTVTSRDQVEGAVAVARRERGALIDFRVEQEDSVYPMVPAGADLHKMIRRPSPIAETQRRRLGRLNQERMQTFAVYVDNKPGVLNRVASLFRRRAFNIESLTVGHTETDGLSRMTIVVDTDERGARLVEANLYKLIPVRRVDNITKLSTIARDLAMIKVSATGDGRTHVMQLVDVYRARIVDVSPDSLVIETTGTEDKIDSLLDVLRPYGVVEMVRTGRVEMVRGTGATSRPASLRTQVVGLEDAGSGSV